MWIRLVAYAAVFSITILVCLVAAEFVARIFVNPVDWLRAEPAADPILRNRLEPGVGGHDGWGFRNVKVPDSVDIVALGDSMTYGNGASASHSWPAWMGRLSNRSVYNLGMGGYGPIEYLYLLEEKALSLSPSMIVVGISLGTDLPNAFDLVYEVDHWASLRDPERPDLLELSQNRVRERAEHAAKSAAQKQERSGATVLRQWLRGSSVLYRMTTISLGDVLRPFELEYLYDSKHRLTVLKDEDGTLVTALNPVMRAASLDFSDLRVSEGLKIAIDVVAGMKQTCEAAGIDYTVVLLPTKIRVFADYRRESEAWNEQAEIIDELVGNEVRAEREFVRALTARGVRVLTVVDELKARVGRERIFQRSADGHPVDAGYRVIADAILKKTSAAKSAPVDSAAEGRSEQAPAERAPAEAA